MLLTIVRTMILYSTLILSVRLMGKRQIGEMEPVEFVVTMLISNLASIPMQDMGIPLVWGIAPILTVLAFQLILAVLSMWNVPFRRMLCGKPVILIGEGVINQRNLIRTRITLDELTEHLRQREVLDLSTVQYAILETNGQISVFLYPKYAPASAAEAGIEVKQQSIPVTIISDGILLEENLSLVGKDRNWLMEVLRNKRCTLSQTFLLTIDGLGKIFFVRKEKGI